MANTLAWISLVAYAAFNFVTLGAMIGDADMGYRPPWYTFFSIICTIPLVWLAIYVVTS